MLIGTPGSATSSICTSTASSVEVRGRDLCGDLMGRLTFTEYFFLLVTGREPTETQRYFLDTLLVVIAEHGLTPTVLAARMTYDADPNSLQGAVAAGILGCGTVILGTADLCAKLLIEAQKCVDAGESPEAATLAIAREIRERRGKIAGYGHNIHLPLDPRAERVLELARQKGVAAKYIALAEHFRKHIPAVWGRAMPMNVSMAIGATLLDLDFPSAVIKGIPILARCAGLLGHLAEESQNPIGFLMAHHGEEAIKYQRAGR
jgi:citrate synthase